MAMIPRYFTASTKRIAETALKKGVLNYPAICYVKDEKLFAWVTQDNELKYIQGDKQITNVAYQNGNLLFYSNNEVISSVFLPMDEDNADEIIAKITETLDTSGYVKANDVMRIVNDRIGYIDNKETVADFVNGFSYNRLSDTPIENKVGTLTHAITVADLDDGIYKVKGQYIIGGDDITVRNCGNDCMFIVTHDNDTTSIIGFSGKNIEKFIIDSNGTKTYEKYITESWMTDRNFVTYDDMKDYVNQMVTESNIELVDQRVNNAIQEQIGSISLDDIQSLFK